MSYAKKMKSVLDKFDPKQAEKILDLLADDEDKGHKTTSEEEKLREKLWKCLDSYQKTMYYLENN